MGKYTDVNITVHMRLKNVTRVYLFGCARVFALLGEDHGTDFDRKRMARFTGCLA